MVRKSLFAVALCFMLSVQGVWAASSDSSPTSNDQSTKTKAEQPAPQTTAAESKVTKDKATDKKTPATSSTMSMMSSGGGSGADGGVAGTPTGSAVKVMDPTNAGTATMAYPIEVAPGRKGIAPQLQLLYSSAATNSWLGHGWNLSLGEIQRSTKFGLNYAANDYVIASGGGSAELIARSDWGANYYGTKQEGGFAKHYFNATTGGWEVTDKSGTKYYYGTTAASRQDSAFGVFKWCLDKVVDLNGNYMTVIYTKDQGEIYPDRIDYTGNGTTTPTNSVKFYLESRTDAPLNYLTNASVRMAYRLKSIDIQTNGQRVRTYKLTYAYSGSTGASLLTSVRQYGTDAVIDTAGNITSGSSLPDTTFEYSGPNHGFGVEIWPGITPGVPIGNQCMSGDLDGDGQTDIWCQTGSGTGMWAVSLSRRNHWSNSVWAGPSVNLPVTSQCLTGDLNGDGKTDMWCETGNGTGQWVVALSMGTYWVTEVWAGPNPGVPIYNQCMTGDLNGDGKTDMWCETGNGTGQWAVALSNGTSWTNTVWAGPNPGLPVGSQCLTADLNGDGKTDFLCETASGSGMWAVGISTGTSWANNIWAGPAVNLPVNTQCMTGDLNGDGKTDFFCQTGVGTGQWHTALSTGSSFANSVWSGVGPALPVGNQCFSGDLNGDGKTDFFCQTGVGTGQWAVSLSTGSSFISSVWSGTGPALPIGNQCIPGDFKGSGKTGFTCETGNGTGVWPTAYPVGGVVDLLSKVNNGIGGSTTITYEPSSTYVNNYLPFIVQTVSSIAVNDGNGNVSVTSYAFTGGLYDKVEREYRGFAYRRVINPIGTMSETWFKTDSVFKGLPYEQVVKDSSNNVYSRTSNTYNSTVVATGVVFPYLQQKDDYLCDGSGTCRQNAASFTYDVYGNVTRQYVHGDVSVSGDERDEYIEYNYDTARWIVAQPATTYVKDAGGVIKSQGWITYDTKGNVLTKTAWLSGGTNPVVTYTYDSFGNQKTITDARNNTSTIDYDSNGIYPVKVTNPLNQFGTKTYDPRFGVVLTETDANNNTTTYTYDVFGRLSTVTKPEEALAGLTTATYAYENFGTVGSQRVAVMMTEGAGTTAAPTCPTGGTYNPATNRCEAAPAATQYTCPVTGQIYSNQTACTNACVQTANCTSNATSITGTGIPFSYGLLTRVWANTSTQLCMSADDGWSNGCFTFPAGVVLSGDVDINTESRLFGWSYTYEKPYSLVGNGSTIDVYVVSYYCAGETCNQVSQPTLKGSITISGATVSSSIFDPTLSNGGITPSGASIIAGWNPGQLNFTLPPTYSCPLSGGSACSGSPMSCSVGQACTSFTPCPTGYTKSGNSCIATPTCPEGGTLNTTTDTCDVKNYVWKETYFDGMGRTIKTRNEGPDGKVIVNEAKYNNLGQTSKNSLPYFEGTETPRWTNMAYDAIGRVLSVTNPDNTVASKSYLRGRTTYVDTRGNVKVEEQDVYGRLVKVEEYSGVYPSQALYATTTYEYDIMGRLVKVTDAANNQTTMTYDTLGRKTGMTDPDMGTWSYAYDANGNMTSQTDAKNQTITFTYDALNRVTQKNYPTGTPVVYTYDETFAVNGKGRLTTVTDSTGSDKYYYDKHGRVVKNTQTIDATDYTTETTYDALNRVRTLKYPDGEIVTNSYGRDGGLNAVNGYVTYSDFTALGQPRTVTYANGVITNFQYNSQNNRLYSITTNSPTQGLQNISYAYDNAGNITTLTDHMDATNTQTFTYDHLSRLTQAQSTAYGTLTWEYNQIGNMTYNSQLGAYTYSTTKPHAVVQAGANVYAYDANGNMSSRKGVAITWNYDNKPSQMGTVQFAYDHSGARVKKIGATTTVYVGKLYECTSGVCTKYIFANGKRIASKKGTNTYYYHTDHLGSASVITDQNGNKVQQVYYYPFGKVRSNIVNGVDVKHKFTGQEEDAEYGLYYYNARYYDPELGRFISADTIVPNPHDPQDLNRYSYVGNNPLKYTDPTGHLKLGSIFKKVVGAIVGIVVTVLTGGSGLAILPGIWAAVAGGAAGGAVSAAVNGGNILKGAIFGAIGGAITGGAFYGAGEIMKGVTDPLVRAAGHAAAGAAVGAATSAIMGGDIGMGALTGFVSGGVSSLAGSLANGLGNTEQLLIRMGAGAVAGGATAAIAGGDVALGVVGGAIVGMAEHLFNKMMHPDDRRDPYKLGKFLVCGAGAVVGEGIYAAGKHALINAASYFGGEAIEIAPAAELAIKKSFQVSDGANAFFGKYETWGQRIGSRIDGCIDWAGGR